MRTLRYRSIAVELIILFVALLIVTTVLAVGHRSILRTEALTALEAVRIADRVAVITALLDNSSPERRADVVRHSQGSTMPVILADQSWIDPDEEQDGDTWLLRQLIADVLPGRETRDVRVAHLSAANAALARESSTVSQKWRQPDFDEPLVSVVEELQEEPTLLVSLQLADGTWLNLVAAYTVSLDFWYFEEIAFVGLMALAIAALSIWAIRQLTSPFRVFADAALRLGTDVRAPPIKEEGPQEVRTAIQAFNRMQKQLQRLLEDRSQMLAAVSHDLRTPITRLRLRSELIDDPQQREKHLADLEQMEQMISEILAFVKDDVIREPSVKLDLTALLQSICDEMSDRSMAVSFTRHGRLPCEGRRLALRRCFTNLIDNAAKYGRKADVSVESTSTDLRVHVDDAGPGIPEDLQELAFRPFHRLDGARNSDRGGAGLGLTVARSIARAHGGDVVLENREGGGLRATVVLSAARTCAPATRELHASE